MKMYCSKDIYFNVDDGYYYIVNNPQPFITEDEALEFMNA